MNSQTIELCTKFIINRDAFKNVFSWDSGLRHLACAMILTLRGIKTDEEKLLFAKDAIKESFGVFSSFRGNAHAFASAMLAATDAPDSVLTDAANIYKQLRKDLYSSDYLPLAAVIIAATAERYDHARIISRTVEIYHLIKKEHPFLTSVEDTLFCALLAMANRSSADLIRDVETCYSILKANRLSSRNSLQSLSHLLALSAVGPAEKCERVMTFFNAFHDIGRRYGTEYELPTLGVLSMTGATPHDAVAATLEIDRLLSTQRGFGFFSSVTKKQRLMFASAIYTKEYLLSDGEESDDDRAITDMMSLAVTCAVLSAIIAQQAASTAAAT